MGHALTIDFPKDTKWLVMMIQILLQEILNLCENRRVLFDNKTKDEAKREEQLQQLLSFVNMVIEKNCGQPYTDELFVELKVRHLLFWLVFCMNSGLSR